MSPYRITPQDIELIHAESKDAASAERLLAHFERRLQQTTRATHQHHVKTLEHFYTFVGMLSPDGILLDANPLAFEVAGVQPEDVLNKPFSEAYWWAHSQESRSRIQEAVKRAAQGETVHYEITAQIADGAQILLDFTLSPYVDENGTIPFLIPVANDITEIRREEDKLRLSEQRFRTFFEQSPIGLAIGTGKGALNPVHVNHSLSDFLEYSQHELESITGYQMLDMISHPEDLKREMTYIQQITNGEREGYKFEKRYYTASGKIVWGELTTMVVKNQAGAIQQTISMVVDITSRKEAEAALRYSETLYRTLMQNLPNTAMLVFDNDLRYLLVEGPLLERVGYLKDETQGRTIWEVLPEESAKLLEPLYRRALAGEMIHYVRQTPDGKHYDSYFYPITSTTGMSGGMLVVHDITDLVEAEQQKLAMEQERSRILSEFITKASHEFRTPLALIGTNAYLVRRAKDEELREKYIRMVETQVSLLSLLIDRMLTMTRVNNTHQFDLSPQHLHRLVNRLIDYKQSQIEDKSLKIDRDFDENLHINVDGNRLIDALSEILVNAIQHTPESSRIIFRTRNDKTNEAVVIEIQDEGPGIAEAHIPYIFEQFYRGDSAHTTRGFGLGLAIAHRIITLHGGAIVASNAEDGGAIMTVRLPRYDPPARE